jgi:hypothetical protein
MTDCHDCKNPVACPAIPRKFLIWDDAIVKAAAEVKPAMTGYEKNSKTKPAEWKIERGRLKNFALLPRLISPSKRMMMPPMSDMKTLAPTPMVVTWDCIKSAMMEVEPMFMALQLPKMA